MDILTQEHKKYEDHSSGYRCGFVVRRLSSVHFDQYRVQVIKDGLFILYNELVPDSFECVENDQCVVSALV